MTKKFGDHKLDKYIGQTGTTGKRYEAQRKGLNGARYEVATIKEARTLVSYNPTEWRLSAEIGRPFGSSVRPVAGVQARPPAAPAAKVHVPKGGGKKPAKPATNAWPFPNGPVHAPYVPPLTHTAIVNGVTIEFDENVKLEIISPYKVKVTKS